MVCTFVSEKGFESSREIQASVLLVPLLGPGSIGQLSVDCLVNTHLHENGLSKLGYLRYAHIVPMVVGKVFDNQNEDQVTLPLELFGQEGSEFVILQRRTPIEPGYEDHFMHALLSWAAETGFSKIVFVDGFSRENQTDVQLMQSSTNTIFYLSTPGFAGSCSIWQSFVPLWSCQELLFSEECYEEDWEDICKPLQIASKTSVEAVVVGRFVSEGDTISEGVLLASALQSLLMGEKASQCTPIQPPKTWELVFGSVEEPDMYW